LLIRRLFAGLALLGALCCLGTFVTAAPALAYQGCNSAATSTANPGAADAGQPIDFTATFRDCNNSGIGNTTVAFSQGAGPAGCTATFSPQTTRTDAGGTAHTTVTLPAGCPCQYTLAATGAGVTVTSIVRENGCLPFTAAAAAGRARAAGGSLTGPGLALVAIGGLLLVISAGYLLAARRV
jgi:hypothetical protein